MVTRSKISRLSSRIDELMDRLGATIKPTFAVYLDFGENDEEFYRRNLTAVAVTRASFSGLARVPRSSYALLNLSKAPWLATSDYKLACTEGSRRWYA